MKHIAMNIHIGDLKMVKVSNTLLEEKHANQYYSQVLDEEKPSETGFVSFIHASFYKRNLS